MTITGRRCQALLVAPPTSTHGEFSRSLSGGVGTKEVQTSDFAVPSVAPYYPLLLCQAARGMALRASVMSTR